jgi:hypothetical protein
MSEPYPFEGCVNTSPDILPVNPSIELVDIFKSRRVTREILFDPFVREGDLCMITGGHGVGKSTFAMDLMISAILSPAMEENKALAGALYLNTEIWQGRKVAVIDYENTEEEWRECFHDSMEQRGYSPESDAAKICHGQILWIDGHSLELSDLKNSKDKITALLSALREAGVGLLFMDALHSAYEVDMNSAEWVIRGLEPLRIALRDAFITFMPLVHTSRDFKGKLKKNKFLPMGTSQQEKCADAILGLEQNKKTNTLSVYLVKRRAGKHCEVMSKIDLELSDTFGGYKSIKDPWPFTNPKIRRQGKKMIESQELIFKDMPLSFAYRDLDHNISTLRRLCTNVLEPQGLAMKANPGEKYSGKNPLRWKLTKAGLNYQATIGEKS